MAAKVDGGNVTEVWVIAVISGKAIVNIYNYGEDMDFTSPDEG